MVTRERQLHLPGFPINIFTDLHPMALEDDLKATSQIYILRKIRDGQDPFFIVHDYLHYFGRKPSSLQRKVLSMVFELTESPKAKDKRVSLKDISEHTGIKQKEVSIALARLGEKDYIERVKEKGRVGIRIADRFMAYALLMNYYPATWAERLQTGEMQKDLEDYHFSPLNRVRACLYDPTIIPLTPLPS